MKTSEEFRAALGAYEAASKTFDDHLSSCVKCEHSDDGSLCAEGERLDGALIDTWQISPKPAQLVEVLAQVEHDRDEAREWVKKLTSEVCVLTCVYCGHAYPPGTPPHGSEVLTEHIRVCEKHPMRHVERQLANALRDRDVVLKQRDETGTLLDASTRFDVGCGVEIVKHWTVGTSSHHWKIVGAVHAHGSDAWNVERDAYDTREEAFEALKTFRKEKLR